MYAIIKMELKPNRFKTMSEKSQLGLSKAFDMYNLRAKFPPKYFFFNKLTTYDA